MINIFEESWNILKKNSKLYYVPILMFFITLFINPIEFGNSFYGTLSFITLTLINIALHTGWLNQIFTSLKDDKTINFEEVLIGIGKFFPKVLNVYILFFVFLLLSFAIFSNFLEKSVNIDPKELEIVFNKFKDLKDINYESIMSIVKSMKAKTLIDLYTLGKYSIIYALIISTIYFFISLWNYIIVFKENLSYKSLLLSSKLIFKRIFSFTFLSFADLIVSGSIIILIINSKSEFLLFLLLLSKIVTQTFFTISFCVFVEKNKSIL